MIPGNYCYYFYIPFLPYEKDGYSMLGDLRKNPSTYFQANEKSSHPDVSEFSISLSITFDTKWAGYFFSLRPRHVNANTSGRYPYLPLAK
jgi:hypothetical protein